MNFLSVEIIASIVFVLLGIRTTLFWLLQWQKRDYRWDRLKDHLSTKEGTKKVFNVWFFEGILPRPELSGRILLISFFFLILSFGILFLFIPTLQGVYFWMNKLFPDFYPLALTFFIWERTIWLTMTFAVFLSKIPVYFVRKRIFSKAKAIIDQAPHVTRIGITGSFGKSSTKEILVHLLISKFGKENVLYNWANQNTELSVARLITLNKSFFSPPSQKGTPQKILVMEMGAYKKGEISTMCRFVQPHLSILTGVGSQHLPLFGSQRNIQEGKFELAEHTSDRVFFNAESPLLAEICAEKEVSATKIPLSRKVVKNLKSDFDSTTFNVYGKNMLLPWIGEFFVMNALLAMEIARELGMTPSEIALTLPSLPPLERALHIKKAPSGLTILNDPYSSNPDGVLAAISQFEKFSGQRIYVGIPLIELGEHRRQAHEKIFAQLKDMKAHIFWIGEDFSDMGKRLCGARFHGQDLTVFKKLISQTKKNDVVLFESRVTDNFKSVVL